MTRTKNSQKQIQSEIALLYRHRRLVEGRIENVKRFRINKVNELKTFEPILRKCTEEHDKIIRVLLSLLDDFEVDQVSKKKNKRN